MSTEQTAPERTTYVTQIRRDSITSLHGRPEWVTLHLATPAELAMTEVMFWLDGDDQPYTANAARRVSDRLARILRVTDEQLAASPQAFDAELARRYEAWEKATTARERVAEDIHAAAGDRKEYQGRRRYWRRTYAEVLETVQIMARHDQPLPPSMSHGRTAADLLARENEAETALAQAALAVHLMEAVYRTAPWPRFFPCTNRDGHIHASYRDCPTVRWDTGMVWRPDLSGRTVDEAVADLGPALCSVCFPLAPVEQKRMTLGQVADERTKGERDAAKAERQAVRDAKQLAGDEQFRTEGSHGELVTTVAACKDLIRAAIEAEVEAEWYGTPEAAAKWEDSGRLAQVRANLAERVLEAQRNAGRAAAVLGARETAHPGWGATPAEITKIQQSKYKRARKDWGLA